MDDFLSGLQDRLEGFGLSISEEKTRTVKFGRRAWQLANRRKEKLETFNFLGYSNTWENYNELVFWSQISFLHCLYFLNIASLNKNNYLTSH